MHCKTSERSRKMNYSGEAAEQVVRMSLNGVEVAAKISGKAAERLAVLLYAVLRDQKKTRGKIRLTNMERIVRFSLFRRPVRSAVRAATSPLAYSRYLSRSA